MVAGIICVGDELLVGDTLNTNTQYLSHQLTEIGVEVRYQQVVGDHEDRLIKAIHAIKQEVDVLIFSGGLGPTYDDMTKEAVAKCLHDSLVMDETALLAIQTFFEKIGRKMAKTNLKQALRPSSGFCLPNDNGTAPGIYVTESLAEVGEESRKVHYFLLPGPPNELVPMYVNQVVPRLIPLLDTCIASKTYKLVGIGESDLAEQIGHLMDHATNPTIAPYAKLGSVHIRVSAKAATLQEAQDLVDKTHEELWPYLKTYCYTTDDRNLEEVVVDQLKALELTIGLAESCTAGLLSSRLGAVSGVSGVFMGAVISYANEVKTNLLMVSEDDLASHGAVSEVVASTMARGARTTLGTSVGIGITGIAGPSGGTKDKPVGTVCIAWDIKDGSNEVQRVNTYHFNGNRQKIRDYSSQYALIGLYEILKNGLT